MFNQKLYSAILHSKSRGENMKQIPIKKYEKLSTIADSSGNIVITKITDFKNKTVTFEVKNNGHRQLFKTLKQAQSHLKKAPHKAENTPKTQNLPYTQASLNF
jgi:hypothetical protein